METEEVFHKDIINQILLNLPAKSLLRFKSVCKSWYDLISSPGFRNNHLQRSLITQSNHHLVFLAPDLYMEDYDTFENAVELNYPYKNSGGVSIVGSCNGLLCLQNWDSVFLYNPTTQTHKIIPTLPRPFRNLLIAGELIHGFGYDSVEDDYKIVRIFYSLWEVTGCECSELMVYSLKSNSWKRILDRVPIRFKENHSDGVLVNENLHWVSHMEFHEPPVSTIVSFNLSTNTLGEVPLPKADTYLNGIIEAGVLDGCLCMLINSSEEYEEFEILVLKEYGVAESWAKLIHFATLEISYTIEKAIAFTRDRKRLLVVLGSFKVGYIDLENLVMEKIDSVVNASTWIFDATLCVENLLMLDDFSHFENKQQGADNSKRRKRETVGEDVRDATGTNESFLNFFEFFRNIGKLP